MTHDRTHVILVILQVNWGQGSLSTRALPCPSLHHTYGFALFQVCRGASEKQMGYDSYMESKSK